MTMPAELPRMLQYALRYAELGFSCLPVNGKFPACKHGVKDATTDPVVLKFWFGDPDCQYGIALAVPDGYAVLDEDPRNLGNETLEDLCDKHGNLPDTAEAMTGGGGRHFLFRIPVGKRLKKAGPGLDSLNPGKYFLVEPSIHPTSQREYAWEASSNLLNGHPVAEAPTWLLEDHTPEQSAVVTPINGTGFLPPERVADLRSALSYLDPDEYDLWIKIGQALHSTEAGNQAFGLWDEWSKGSDKYRPGETRKKWRTFRAGGGINVESVFALAGQNGWVNTAVKPKTEKEKQRDELRALVEESSKTVDYERIDVAPTPIRAIPVPALAELASWIGEQLDVRHGQAIVATTLALGSAIAARQYVSNQGDPAHLHIGLLCQSVSEVRAIKGIAQALLADTGLRKLIRGTRMTSLSSVYRTMERHPAAFYMSDDYGQMLAFARRQPSGILDQALNAIADIYHGNDLYIDPDLDNFKNDECRVIYKPAIALLAAIPEDQIALLTKRGEIGRGLLQQMLLVDIGDGIQQGDTRRRDVPSGLRDTITALQDAPDHQGNLAGLSIACLPPSPKFVAMSPGAAQVVAEYDQLLLTVAAEDKRLFPLAKGARQTMRRILTTLAAWKAPTMPHADADLATWAGLYTLDHLQAFARRYAVIANDTGDLDVSQEVLSQIIKAGPDGLTRRILTNYCWSFRKLSNDKRGEVIEALLGDEEAYYLDAPGKKSKVFVAKQFVKEKQV